MESKSLALAKKFLNKEITVVIDRPLGSRHPQFKRIKYTCNYGHIEGIRAPDGDFLDAYLLQINEPVRKYTGKVVAIVHRLTNDDDKLVVIPKDNVISHAEIEKSIWFQEKWSKSDHTIIRE